jgi:hypothetical protein
VLLLNNWMKPLEYVNKKLLLTSAENIALEKGREN